MPSTRELLLCSLSLLVLFFGSTDGAADGAAGSMVDLSQYSRLYVRYQNCVWSPYANGCGNNNNNNNQQQNQNKQNNYWYSALAPCYRANVAYTVYGVKVDDTGTYKSGGECKNKSNYVGSYFTTNGVEDFFDALTLAGVTLTIHNDANGDGDGEGEEKNNAANGAMGNCEVISSQAGDNDENNNNNKQEAAQYDYTANNRKMYGESISAGLGCSNKHKYAVKTYQGAYCDERAVLEVTDELETLNDELEDNAQCVLIYAAAVAAPAAEEAEDAAADGDADVNEQQAEQQEINNAGDLLVNSETCNVRLYPQTCPDPHGLLRSDARAVGQRLSSSRRRHLPLVRRIFSWIFMSLGVLFIAASAWACCNKTARAENFKRNRANHVNNFSSSNANNKGWRSQFTRTSEIAADQQKQLATGGTGSGKANTATPARKKRRFFRLFSRGAKS